MKRARKTLRAKVRTREIRIENTLTDEKGKEARLKEGAEVELQIEAEKEATTGKR